MKNFVSRAASFNPGGKFLILFNNPNEPRSPEFGADLASRIFSMMYKTFNVANAIVLFAIDAHAYNVYVTDPYNNKDECGTYLSLRSLSSIDRFEQEYLDLIICRLAETDSAGHMQERYFQTRPGDEDLCADIEGSSHLRRMYIQILRPCVGTVCEWELYDWIRNSNIGIGSEYAPISGKFPKSKRSTKGKLLIGYLTNRLTHIARMRTVAS